MKLCFFGKSRMAREWLSILRQGGQHSITHCTDGGHVLSALTGGEGTFDWLLVEGQEAAGEGGAVARTVRAMGYGVPIAFLGFEDQAEERDGPSTATLRVHEGRRQHPRLITCVFPKKLGRGLEESLVLYEYTGPGRKPGSTS